MASFRCIQVNLQHAKAASAVLVNRFTREHLDVAFIQEPYLVKNQIKALTGELLYVTSTEGGPRACLLFKKGIKYIPLLRFCSRDQATAKVELKINGVKKIIVLSSAYLPGDNERPDSQTMKDVVEYCTQNKLQLIIGSDANAHHTIWGSSNINKRGEYLLEYIYCHQLEILNIGDKPTFVNRMREEVLDITLSTLLVSTKIQNWHVSDETSMSDHRHIRFDLEIGQMPTEMRRVPKATNWDRYDQILAEALSGTVGGVRNTDNIELADKALNNAIMQAYHGACPEKPTSGNRKVPWWNNSLTKLRIETRRKFNRARSGGNWDDYRISLTEYNKEIRRAKRKSWRNFCSEITELPSGARLHKILSKTHTNRMGLMEKPDGTTTVNEGETLKLLAQTHFPGSTIVEPNTMTTFNHAQRPCTEDWRLARNIFTESKIKWAINSFGSYKTAGEDNIFPALLQKGIERITPRLIHIFRASHAWGYIPEGWRTVKVTFIPKAGGRPGTQPKSFRPISLTSFLLKTMEKIIDRHIRDNVLRLNPLHKHQYAYQQGKSTTIALQNLVSRIQKTFDAKEVALGCFLDIEGAFDNTNFSHIQSAATAKGVDNKTCNWISSMLNGRVIKTALAESELEVTAAKGCPQGGVISPLLWLMVADELLVKLSECGFYAQGYADDIVILVQGKFEETVSDRMQVALNIVAEWCESSGLRVNPKKSHLVAFTKRRNKDKLRKPILFGETINYSKEVKYLGIILDERLNWNSQLDKATEKAISSLWTCRRLAGKTWGMGPKVMYYMYTMIARPIATYAASVWWKKAQQRTAKTKLNGVQRLACLGITGAMHTTPTIAMEVLLGMLPLHLFIKKEALIAAHGSLTGKTSTEVSITHQPLLRQILNDHLLKIMLTDECKTLFDFQKNFKISLPTREQWTNHEQLLDNNALIFYTDGSKMDCGTGSGVYGKNPGMSIIASLSRYCTVFQAEVHAIELCAREIENRGYSNRKIYILSDSKAAILAIGATEIQSKLVWDCTTALKHISNCNRVTLMWVPGHRGIVGNELADELARAGSLSGLVGPEPFCGLSPKVVKTRLHEMVMDEAQQEWEECNECRQSKLFLPAYSTKLTNWMFSLDRVQMKSATGFLTGHCAVRAHLKKMLIESDDSCRLCHTEEESAEHLLCNCEAIARIRLQKMGSAFLQPGEIMSDCLRDLPEFLKRIREVLESR